jgi:hypothetical protein
LVVKDFPIHEAIALAYVLEEHISRSFHLYPNIISDGQSIDAEIPPVIADLIQFYTQPELHSRQISFSPHSQTQQLLHPQKKHPIPNKPTNFFETLFSDTDTDTMTMEVESQDHCEDQTNP